MLLATTLHRQHLTRKDPSGPSNRQHRSGILNEKKQTTCLKINQSGKKRSACTHAGITKTSYRKVMYKKRRKRSKRMVVKCTFGFVSSDYYFFASRLAELFLAEEDKEAN